MAIYPKVNGAHKEMTDCKVKVAGAWKQAKLLFTKVNGVWKAVWTNGIEIFTDTLEGVTIEKTFNKITSSVYFRNIKLTLYRDDGTESTTTYESLSITQSGTNIYYEGSGSKTYMQIKATTVPLENKIRFYIYIKNVGSDYAAARLFIERIDLI